MDNVNTYKVNKEAVKKIAEKVYDNGSTVINRNDLEELFPELQESGDERIREALIKYYSFDKDGGSHALDNITPKQIVAWLKKQGEQKPTVEMKTPEESLGIDSDIYNKIVDECVYGEQKPAWSEEDEKILNLIIARLHSHPNVEAEEYGKDYHWFKSLKERYVWKPSDGQMECLGYAIEKAEKDWSPLTNNRVYLTLKALKEQLLELRGSKV